MPGETLVLLPGMMCDGRLFAPQIEALAGDHHLVVAQLAGHTTMEGMARRVLRETGENALNLCGLSMGGIVAMEMLRLAPHRIRRLALLDTNHRADTPERKAVRNRQIEDVRRGRLRQVMAEEMKPAYLAEANRRNSDLLDRLLEMAMDLGPQTFIEQTLALRDRPDQSSTLSGFSGPALVLCGEEDRLCPPERHREIAGLLALSKLCVVPGAGHISTLERPGCVTDHIQDWLRSELPV